MIINKGPATSVSHVSNEKGHVVQAAANPLQPASQTQQPIKYREVPALDTEDPGEPHVVVDQLEGFEIHG
jgi:hypothetical protein